MKDFSIVTSVYKNDNPEYVRLALDSMMVNQILKPSEIVLVRDGLVSDALESLLCEYEIQYANVIRVIRLDQNGGLGKALKLGVEEAKHNIIARMDSDDICDPNRFELQMRFLEENPDVDIVGGQMTEFIGSPDNIVGKRVVPCTNEEIYEYMRERCALNHVTVMFKKQTVLNAGNYQDWFWNEDYYLWVRMMINRSKFANLPETLVNVRSGIEQYARRGGIKYFKSEAGIQRYMLENDIIGKGIYMLNIAKRLIVQILLPNSIRGWVFRKFART